MNVISTRRIVEQLIQKHDHPPPSWTQRLITVWRSVVSQQIAREEQSQ